MINRIKQLNDWKLVLLSGILIGLSYPPTKLGFLVWVGFVPLLILIDHNSPRSCGKYFFFSGVMSNLIVMYWLAFNSGEKFIIVLFSMIGGVLYLSLFWLVLGYAIGKIHVKTGKGFVLLPFLWTAMEYLISFGSLGFPWISLATTQTDFLPVIQMAEFTGIYGISFWLITVNILIFKMMKSPTEFSRIIRVWLILTLVLPWLYGYGRIFILDRQNENENLVHVAAVQPDVGPSEKWEPKNRDRVFRQLDSLFMEAAETNPDLIIWPECATPAYLLKNEFRFNQVYKNVQATQIPLLSGIIDWDYTEKGRKVYNSAILITPEKEVTKYDKIKLTPFGEYVPFSNFFNLLDKLNIGVGNYDHGNTYSVFEVNSVSFSTVICFESVFPQLIRKFVLNGAEYLVIIANDGWYGFTSEPFQHAALSRLRAIEQRIPVVRCANTGISMIYDRAGRIKSKLGLGENGVVSAGIIPRTSLTFYGKFGDVFAIICIITSIMMTFWLWRRER